MDGTEVIQVRRNDRPGKVARTVVEAFDRVRVVKLAGGRSTVATMSQVAERVATMRPDAALDSVQRHQGATWTWSLPD